MQSFSLLKQNLFSKNKLFLKILALLVLVAGAYAAYQIIRKENIPSPVKTKYKELAESDKFVNASLAYCKSGGKIIYQVSGDRGLFGITYLYDSKGEELGTRTFGDLPPFVNPLKPPVEVDRESCVELSNSMLGNVVRGILSRIFYLFK